MSEQEPLVDLELVEGELRQMAMSQFFPAKRWRATGIAVGARFIVRMNQEHPQLILRGYHGGPEFLADCPLELYDGLLRKQWQRETSRHPSVWTIERAAGPDARVVIVDWGQL